MKEKKKLSLSRETVRALTDEEIAEAVGGGVTSNPNPHMTPPCYALSPLPSCLPSCYCTPMP